MTTLISTLFFAATVAQPACLPVTASRIFGSDLAHADPRFSPLPSGLVVSFAPNPGMKRVISAAELSRIARVNRLAIEAPSEICFEFPVHPLSEEQASTAMHGSLPSGATLRILSLTTTPVPEGEIHFPLNELDSAASHMWRGYVVYSGNRRAPVWAEVSVSMLLTSVMAATDLPPNIAIDPASLREVNIATSDPSQVARSGAIGNVDAAKGRAPKAPIKAGSIIRAGDLIDVPAVHRGDSVRVEVRSGLARLHFDAIAEAPASAGETVEFRNPVNGKTFKARIESPSTAVILIEGHSL
jgi:flagella basal body P-ring formation protein FlgA